MDMDQVKLRSLEWPSSGMTGVLIKRGEGTSLGPVVKNLPSPYAGSAGSVPVQGADVTHVSRGQKKKQNIKEKPYCNKFNSIKTLKMVNIKKNL